MSRKPHEEQIEIGFWEESGARERPGAVTRPLEALTAVWPVKQPSFARPRKGGFEMIATLTGSAFDGH